MVRVTPSNNVIELRPNKQKKKTRPKKALITKRRYSELIDCLQEHKNKRTPPIVNESPPAGIIQLDPDTKKTMDVFEEVAADLGQPVAFTTTQISQISKLFGQFKSKREAEERHEKIRPKRPLLQKHPRSKLRLAKYDRVR